MYLKAQPHWSNFEILARLVDQAKEIRAYAQVDSLEHEEKTTTLVLLRLISGTFEPVATRCAKSRIQQPNCSTHRPPGQWTGLRLEK